MTKELFNIQSKYSPSPDQANAIDKITKNIVD
jgi:excinuclease UvrABC helicase subunit UvrB